MGIPIQSDNLKLFLADGKSKMQHLILAQYVQIQEVKTINMALYHAILKYILKTLKIQKIIIMYYVFYFYSSAGITSSNIIT